MQVKAEQLGDIFHVKLMGKIDYSTVDVFSKICLKDLLNQRVVFNCLELEFVGSHGISLFVDSITRLSNKNPCGVKLCHLGYEFYQIFETSQFPREDIHHDLEMAYYSFYTPVYANGQAQGACQQPPSGCEIQNSSQKVSENLETDSCATIRLNVDPFGIDQKD